MGGITNNGYCNNKISTIILLCPEIERIIVFYDTDELKSLMLYIN